MKFLCNARLFAGFLILSSFVACGAYAQTAEENGPVSMPDGKTAVLKTSTQLVIVDVVVQDGNGNPVHGLTRESFHISENKNQQGIRQFEEHSSVQTAVQPEGRLDLPPGTFTDYIPAKESGPLNVLVLDNNNTSPENGLFVRNQLKEFIKQAAPNAKMAIIAMNAGYFTVLQGFTSDPRILKDAAANKLDLIASPVRGGNKRDTRVKLTLDTFIQLAQYLSSFPGRKNLLWFSSSFRMDVTPSADPDMTIPDMYREMTNQFARAQITVYPISADGLDAPMNVNPASRRPGPRNATVTMAAQFQMDDEDHGTMDKFAEDTGGHAVYNVNGLAEAAKNAIDAGANYYTLAYSPTDHNWDSRFRTIHVDLAGTVSGRHLKLTYRRGYYADDPSASSNKKPMEIAQANAPNPGSTRELRNALSFGAPEPADIVFKVMVVPATSSVEQTVAADNHLGASAKAPYKRYTVNYAAIARTLSWKTYADGHMECDAELGALVYDHEGRLVNSVTQPLHYKVSLADYKLLTQNGMQLHLDVSAPAKGDSYLRLAIHDLTNNKFGVVEVPTSVVANLAPAL